MKRLKNYAARSTVRRAGPLLICLGVCLSVPALVEFLTTFGFLGPLHLTWCWTVGMPLLLVGISLTGSSPRPAHD